MNKTLVIQFKAAFLLFIFSLNMFVGFACSLGLNAVGEASSHHPEAVKQSSNTHNHSHEHGKAASKSHHHETAKPHDHNTAHRDAPDKKGCCNDEVQKVQQLDKNIESNAKIFSFDIVADVPQTHYKSCIINFSKTNLAKLRERFFYPPPPNILLKIQRFQI